MPKKTKKETKPVLKTEAFEFVAVINAYDLDKYINEVYGLKEGHYNCIADHEWHNDSCYIIEAQKGKLSEGDSDFIEQIRHNEGSYHLYAIFKDLCNKGLLKPGNYLIRVCW